MFYFERLGPSSFRASEHVGGAWNPAEQHIAPALGLIAHAIERDHAARRDDRLRLVRLSYDILGTLPIDVVEVEVSVLRPGRTIELVEARLAHGGRTAVVARAWLLQAFDTGAFAGTAFPAIPSLESMAPWQVGETWPGGFVRSVDVRRTPLAKGRAASWVRSDLALVAGEAVSTIAQALTIVDIANGLAPREAVNAVAFPNVDLTVHLFAEPQGPWLGFDTTVSFGTEGIGLTNSTLHDRTGPIGVVSQCLTIRAR
ncbi:thioesterase family protein [Novosphingobium sp. JCM 18896]|uniref:thioesterase family protein n=1 Tax=Novosphingobium sp. JCM 18896 TaxID=2989731 RepID=UPI002222EE18|nr:thioesterase family protein [Novosphingobium sp. JCM 18896]MCW1430785.1 thioesterase family protein [Novosphingobium sp. JCM 18896]